MNKLQCRKQKMNGKFECKRTKKIINIKECTNCKYKEYKTSAENNRAQQKISKRNEQISKRKSKKLAKMERNRYSVFTDDLKTCFYSNKDCFGCITKHELFSGRNRQHSMNFGFVIPLCEFHHSTLQEHNDFNQYWHDRCREYSLMNYGSLDEFIEVFGKSYFR